MSDRTGTNIGEGDRATAEWRGRIPQPLRAALAAAADRVHAGVSIGC